MNRYLVKSQNGPTIKTWAYSARNARFAYILMYRDCGRVVATEIAQCMEQ